MTLRQRVIREDLTRAALGFGASAILFAGICLFAFALIHRRISRPLAAFQRGFQALATGDLDHRIPVEGGDELAELAGQYNETVELLQDALRSRDEAFAALEREEKMLRRTERIARIGSWEWDLAADEMQWSREMFRIFEMDPTEDAPYFAEQRDLFPAEDYARVQEAVEEAIRRGSRYELDLDIHRADGSLRHGVGTAEVETNAEGEVVRLVGSLQDITARREAQEEAEALERRLERASRLEAIGRLAGGVAHDFNNMLTVIRGYAGLVSEELGPDHRLHADVEQIEEAAEQSRRLTEHLLTFAREKSITPESLDLNAVIEGMLPLLRRLLGEEVEIVWSPTEELWKIEIDRSHIGQIITNLCVNARDAIEEQGTIEVATRNVTEIESQSQPVPRGSWVMLSVTDDGSGMDPETLDQVFEPFFTTKELGRGTGLGLATVYGVVRENEAFIDVQSEPGEGSRFEILFPRSLVEEEETTLEPPEDLAAEHGQSVLVVEDDMAILQLCQQILERLGYSVLATDDPMDALGLAEKHDGRIDLLVTDVVMPEMNGRALARHLRKIHPEMAVLFMSGYSPDVVTPRDLGEETSFIQKPFSPRDLGSEVQRVLSREEDADRA